LVQSPEGMGKGREAYTRLPMAGFLTLAVVLAMDSGFLGSSGPWQTLYDRSREHALERGVARDRMELRHLSEAPPTLPRVIVIGSSRANAGFRPDSVDPETRERYAFAKIAHAFVAPFEIRSAVEDMLAVDADVVVVVLSEFDVNRPVLITPQAGFASLSAIRDLSAELGLQLSFHHRRLLYRLTMARILNGYRYRGVLHRAFVDELRRFPLDERFPVDRVPAIPPFVVDDGKPTPLTRDELRDLAARLAEALPHARNRGMAGFGNVRQITRGDHARIQRGLIRRAVQRLRAAGKVVIIIEAPLHPVAAELYDTTIREDFLSFAFRVVEDFGVHFVPLDSVDPFRAEEFSDLTHLGTGRTRFSRMIVDAVAKATDF